MFSTRLGLEAWRGSQSSPTRLMQEFASYCSLSLRYFNPNFYSSSSSSII